MCGPAEALLSTGQMSGILGQGLLQLINILTNFYFEVGNDAQYPTDYSQALLQNPTQLFDFIIIGGGTAGTILANRLSEKCDWQVLIIEAGGPPSANTEVPMFYDRIKNTEEAWQFTTEKEKKLCQGMIEKKCRLFSGKMLGGTTSMSDMHYERASHVDLEGWGGIITGSDANNHYNKIEHYNAPSNIYKLGESGDVHLNKFENFHPLMDLILDSAKSMDYTKITSCNQYLGYYESNAYIHNGFRYNFAKAFLSPVKERPNLFIAMHSTVTRIISDEPIDNRVRGVQVIIDKKEVTVRAKLEVILTAGTVNSAKILQLSGFGNKDLLKMFSIPLKTELTIGANFRDQIGVPIFITLGNCDESDRIDYDDSMYQFLKHKRGPYSRINVHNIVGVINTKESTEIGPNIKMYHYHFAMDDVDLRLFLEVRGYVSQIVTSIVAANKKSAILVLMPVLVNPRSFGQIKIQSGNPMDPPKIIGNYLSDADKQDEETLIGGYNFVAAFVETPPMNAMNAQLLKFEIPNCRNYKACTDQFAKCYVQNMGTPMSNYVGTVQFGNFVDKCETCVNCEFLLEGIRHLRVVDSSILPNALTSNPTATVGMLADLAVDKILKTWGKS